MTAIALAYLAGAVTVMCWNGSWFVFDELAARLRQPSRVQAEDQALAVANVPGQEATR